MQTLGKGAFAEVHLVRRKLSRDLFALKSMSKCEMLKRYEHTTYLSYSPPDISFSIIFPVRTQARHSGLSSTSWRAGSEWVVSLHHSFMNDMYLYLLMELLPGMCKSDALLCLFIPFTTSPHVTQHTGGHLGCMMDSYDIPAYWALFTSQRQSPIHKVQ
jgi:serine/threonine protein kinase